MNRVPSGLSREVKVLLTACLASACALILALTAADSAQAHTKGRLENAYCGHSVGPAYIVNGHYAYPPMRDNFVSHYWSAGRHYHRYSHQYYIFSTYGGGGNWIGEHLFYRTCPNHAGNYYGPG